jgi:peptidoglycan LD-endopeptidase LytH
MSLSKILFQNKAIFQPVIHFEWLPKTYQWLDFSATNLDLQTRDFTTTAIFNDYVFDEMLNDSSQIGIGGYNENRIIYRRSEHFNNETESRSIHLGIDIWAKAGTKIFAPLDGHIHSFGFNDNFGDYGPTIVIRHVLDGHVFHTLYGHLSLDSIENLVVNQPIAAGQEIARFGDFPINGDWPPHLHFQVIADMQGKLGDYPGVCKPSKSDFRGRVGSIGCLEM